MSKRSDYLLLTDILDAINTIDEFLVGITENDFYNDKKTKLATVRCLEIIGEASQKVSKELKEQSTNIHWREATDLRNKIIHEYSGLDYVLLWDVIHDDIPLFKQQISELLNKLHL